MFIYIYIIRQNDQNSEKTIRLNFAKRYKTLTAAARKKGRTRINISFKATNFGFLLLNNY